MRESFPPPGLVRLTFLPSISGRGKGRGITPLFPSATEAPPPSLSLTYIRWCHGRRNEAKGFSAPFRTTCMHGHADVFYVRIYILKVGVIFPNMHHR